MKDVTLPLTLTHPQRGAMKLEAGMIITYKIIDSSFSITSAEGVPLLWNESDNNMILPGVQFRDAWQLLKFGQFIASIVGLRASFVNKPSSDFWVIQLN